MRTRHPLYSRKPLIIFYESPFVAGFRGNDHNRANSHSGGFGPDSREEDVRNIRVGRRFRDKSAAVAESYATGHRRAGFRAIGVRFAGTQSQIPARDSRKRGTSGRLRVSGDSGPSCGKGISTIRGLSAGFSKNRLLLGGPGRMTTDEPGFGGVGPDLRGCDV